MAVAAESNDNGEEMSAAKSRARLGLGKSREGCWEADIGTLVGSIEPNKALGSPGLTRALARAQASSASGERPGDASLKRAAWT